MFFPLLAEFFGTFALLFSILTTGNFAAIGATLALVIFLICDVSGAHVNPAVSLVMLLKGGLEATKFGGYVLAQSLGAVAAFYTYKLVLGGGKK